MKQTQRRLFGLGALALVLALSIAFAACGGDGSSSTDGDRVQDEPTQVAGDAHDEPTQVAGEAHDEAEENAYLEVAPKDTLFLVEMTSLAFTPNVLEVNAGDVIELAVQNVEPFLHDFTIDEVAADVHISYLGGTGEHAHVDPDREADVHFALSEQGTGVVHLKVSEPGEYVFYCSVPGHREGGMEGTLIVR